MNNFLTFHAEATPDGVNIMHRSNDGMTERVETVSYIDAVNRLDAGDYDDKPDEGMFIHLAIASGGNQGYFDYTSQHHVIMEGANKQVISSQVDSLIKISRIWADFFPANTSNQPI